MLLSFLTLLLSHSAFSADIVVPKAKFTEEFKAALPANFCADKAFFRKCFTVTPEVCKSTVTTAVTACIVSLDKELPLQFHQPADGKKWGEVLGGCAGEKFEVELQKSKVESADCKDPTKWQ